MKLNFTLHIDCEDDKRIFMEFAVEKKLSISVRNVAIRLPSGREGARSAGRGARLRSTSSKMQSRGRGVPGEVLAVLCIRSCC